MSKIALVLLILITVVTCGCSDGGKNISEALKGVIDSNKDQVPDIVKEQRRKEKIRQNTMWTEENQALHPLEYCQAQLTAVSKYEEDLSVLLFCIRKRLASNENQQEKDRVDVARYKDSFGKMKLLYLKSEETGAWPVEYNGIQMSKDKLQDAIIDIDAEIKRIEGGFANLKQRNIVLEKKMTRIRAEQKTLADLKRKINDTILSLKEKKVVGETSSIKEALTAINASIGAINEENGVSIDDIVDEKPEEIRKRRFQDIISKE